MKTVFAGTPEFARVALEAIAEAGFEIALVLTQPDRPAGRGMKLQASPVKQFAIGRGIPVAQPRSLRLDGKYPEDAAAARAALEAAGADVMVVAAYGLILPQWVLDLPRLGCLNIHASLLPRWRGAAPIHRAIEAGDETTGVTIMQMDAGLDTGAMLLTESLAIGDDSTARLHDRLAALGGRMIVEALHKAGRGELRPVAQPAEGVNYAHKVDKAEALLDWSQPAELLARRVRAFDPAPGAGSVLDGVPIKVWAAEPRAAAPGAAGRDADPASVAGSVADASGAPAGAAPVTPGTVLAVSAAGIEVAAGASILRITELQRSGGKRLPVAEFLRGFDVKPGQVLG